MDFAAGQNASAYLESKRTICGFVRLCDSVEWKSAKLGTEVLYEACF